jgi:hypothetical protein
MGYRRVQEVLGHARFGEHVAQDCLTNGEKRVTRYDELLVNIFQWD